MHLNHSFSANTSVPRRSVDVARESDATNFALHRGVAAENARYKFGQGSFKGGPEVISTREFPSIGKDNSNISSFAA